MDPQILPTEQIDTYPHAPLSQKKSFLYAAMAMSLMTSCMLPGRHTANSHSSNIAHTAASNKVEPLEVTEVEVHNAIEQINRENPIHPSPLEVRRDAGETAPHLEITEAEVRAAIKEMNIENPLYPLAPKNPEIQKEVNKLADDIQRDIRLERPKHSLVYIRDTFLK
jgi:CHAT domain-containing protein